DVDAVAEGVFDLGADDRGGGFLRLHAGGGVGDVHVLQLQARHSGPAAGRECVDPSPVARDGTGRGAVAVGVATDGVVAPGGEDDRLRARPGRFEGAVDDDFATAVVVRLH